MNFPWLSFLWLISPLPLSEQYNSVSCKDRLGHWFKSWCAYWVARGDLDSRAARADLEGTLILLQEDMAEIEAIHAAIRRELVVLSTQSKTLGFMELSDRHELRCARTHPIHYGVTPHKKWTGPLWYFRVWFGFRDRGAQCQALKSWRQNWFIQALAVRADSR